MADPLATWDVPIILEGMEPEYGNWLDMLDDICERFLNAPLDVLPWEDDMYDWYANELPPWRYFLDVIVTVLKEECNDDYVDRIIAENIMWGRSRSIYANHTTEGR